MRAGAEQQSGEQADSEERAGKGAGSGAHRRHRLNSDCFAASIPGPRWQPEKAVWLIFIELIVALALLLLVVLAQRRPPDRSEDPDNGHRHDD